MTLAGGLNGARRQLRNGKKPAVAHYDMPMRNELEPVGRELAELLDVPFSRSSDKQDEIVLIVPSARVNGLTEKLAELNLHPEKIVGDNEVYLQFSSGDAKELLQFANEVRANDLDEVVRNGNAKHLLAEINQALGQFHTLVAGDEMRKQQADGTKVADALKGGQKFAQDFLQPFNDQKAKAVAQFSCSAPKARADLVDLLNDISNAKTAYRDNLGTGVGISR
jgi:hypothetical protein